MDPDTSAAINSSDVEQFCAVVGNKFFKVARNNSDTGNHDVQALTDSQLVSTHFYLALTNFYLV